MLADAEPTRAARAAIVMAEGMVDEPTVPTATRDRARRMIELGVEKLAERIRSAREPSSDKPGPDDAAAADEDADRDDQDNDSDDVVPGHVRVTLVEEYEDDTVAEKTRGRPAILREQSAAIREWARRNGYRISTRARISPDIVSAFHTAHQGRDPVPLKPREREIAELVGRGLNNREIADLLSVSTVTVEGHLFRAVTKLGVPDLPALLNVVRADADADT
jgi:DNA-binding CsgD family transcriptional regulator